MFMLLTQISYHHGFVNCAFMTIHTNKIRRKKNVKIYESNCPVRIVMGFPILVKCNDFGDYNIVLWLSYMKVTLFIQPK